MDFTELFLRVFELAEHGWRVLAALAFFAVFLGCVWVVVSFVHAQVQRAKNEVLGKGEAEASHNLVRKSSIQWLLGTINLVRKSSIQWLFGAIIVGIGTLFVLFRFFLVGKTITVLVSLSPEEMRVIEEELQTFERQQRMKWEPIHVVPQNLEPSQIINRLQEGNGDIVIFDVNLRHKLLKPSEEMLVQELWMHHDDHTVDHYTRSVASSLHPALLRNLTPKERKYLLPFRANAKLVFVRNGHKCSVQKPKTWQDFEKCASEINDSRHPRASMLVHDDDGALLLLEFMRSFGVGDESLKNLCSDDAIPALKKLREIRGKFDEPEGSTWHTLTGSLLSGEVEIARSWAFSLAIIRATGQVYNFKIYPGWNYEQKKHPSYLLGGDLIGISRHAPSRDLVEIEKVIEFLLSSEVQARISRKLAWPGMAVDLTPQEEDQVDMINSLYAERGSLAELPGLSRALEDSKKAADKENDLREQLRMALLSAKPTPSNWSDQMLSAYLVAFHDFVDNQKTTLRQLLKKLQDNHSEFCMPGPNVLSEEALVPSNLP